MTETQVGEDAVRWLVLHGWDTYQEVAFRGSVIDIVATLGPLVWAIECKTTFSIDVIAQAHNWLAHASFVSVAIPRARGGWFAQRICKDYGIGVIRTGRPPLGDTAEMVVPHLWRRTGESLRKALHVEQMSQRAGAAGGGHWTPFKATCAKLRSIVAASPGITMREAVAVMKQHHYVNDSAARASLSERIKQGVVPGVRLESVKGERALRLYPT